MTRVIRRIGIALLLALPALAQTTTDQKPSLEGTPLVVQGPPPVRDESGNPLASTTRTEAERETESTEEEARRAEIRRAEEQERVAAEARRAADQRRADDERRAAEHLAEEIRFHDRIMTAVYVGLAIAAFVVWRFLKRR